LQEEADQLGLTPSGRINEPIEVARVIALLASDAAPNLTASSITLDGAATKGIV